MVDVVSENKNQVVREAADVGYGQAAVFADWRCYEEAEKLGANCFISLPCCAALSLQHAIVFAAIALY
jgi:hypothetical protein